MPRRAWSASAPTPPDDGFPAARRPGAFSFSFIGFYVRRRNFGFPPRVVGYGDFGFGVWCAPPSKNTSFPDLPLVGRLNPTPSARIAAPFLQILGGTMVIKISIHEAGRVTYMMVREDELDAVVARDPGAEIFVLNILG